MEIAPQIFTAKVMHRRSFPKENRFTYEIYYLALPLSQLNQQQALKVNERGGMSLQEKDFGARNGSSLHGWAMQQLAEHGLDAHVKEIVFVTMPRILGYGFNPVSFYLALDESGQLRAFIAEVHNTFGESHSYIGGHADRRAIDGNEWIETDKLFHVSPFLTRDGHYRFRIAHEAAGKLGIWIDYVNPNGETQLFTSLTGTLHPLSKTALRRTALRYPLMTFKTIALIHWQALKLFAKRVRYIVKPPQKETKTSAARQMNKM